jgi:AraC-like DNA-binding protein
MDEGTMNDQWQELIAIANACTPGDGVHATAIPWMQCVKWSHPTTAMPVIHQPSLCFVLQGAKQVLLEDEVYHYRASRFTVISLDIPVMSQIVQATPLTPYLCLHLGIDLQTIGDLVARQGAIVDVEGADRGIFVSEADHKLTDAILRLARLLHTPEDIPFLASMYMNEMYYYLLKSEHGAQIARMVAGNTIRRLAPVFHYIKNNIHQTIQIDQLAEMAHMSVSSLHHLFKAATTMSPLQYHKRLRLLESRRLMLSEQVDATTAGARVGYESASQFNREYRRFFGTPPRQDILNLRTLV